MRSSVGKHLPLIMTITILWLTVAVLSILSIKQNQEHLVYALDDPYIHMAVAKNFAQHGVWGVTRFAFSSSSSSLLWPLILSATYFMVGPNELTPIVLNIIFATFAVVSAYWIFNKYRAAFSSSYVFLVLLAIIFLTPLPALIFTGQEHVLHALITILFVHLSAKALSTESQSFLAVDSVLLLVLAPFVPLIRYEGLFLALVVCGLFVVRKRSLYAFSLGALAISPVGIFGIISLTHGWFWFPNSVLLKANLPDLTSANSIISFLGSSMYEQLLATPHISVLTIIALTLYVARFNKEGFWENGQVMITIFTLITFLHMQFARVGSFYRYEAYLVALGLFVLAIPLFQYLSRGPQKINLQRILIPQYAAILMLTLLLMLPLIQRGIGSIREVPQATTNIYQQQYQMGLFLRQFYQGAAVAANDIGAINYLADINSLDLWGLNSLEVAKMKRDGDYDREQIYNLTKSKRTRIAIVYDEWFLRDGIGGIPSQWIRVGQWKIRNNVVAGGNTVSFYAVDDAEEGRLSANLKLFASKLPMNVEQAGKYTK